MFFKLFQTQTVHDGRHFMKFIDPKLGVALPERDYGGNCLIYDPGNVSDPFHNIWVRIFIQSLLNADDSFNIEVKSVCCHPFLPL